MNKVVMIAGAGDAVGIRLVKDFEKGIYRRRSPFGGAGRTAPPKRCIPW